MAGYAVKRIDDMEAVFLGGFKRARAELGVESFGMQVMDLPPNLDRYPEHDHAEDGQEEVYIPLGGRGEIDIEGERFALEPGVMVRVSPGTSRKVYTQDEPIRLLIVGGVPGQVYEPPEISKLGVPDPLAQQAQ
jgi:quercetin dioxygenase-like cupin family protein